MDYEIPFKLRVYSDIYILNMVQQSQFEVSTTQSDLTRLLRAILQCAFLRNNAGASHVCCARKQSSMRWLLQLIMIIRLSTIILLAAPANLSLLLTVSNRGHWPVFTKDSPADITFQAPQSLTLLLMQLEYLGGLRNMCRASSQTSKVCSPIPIVFFE